ncbi:MAG: pyridoxal phosphate-dependent aminotransferase [candidate division WOR-3 bacterium]
MRISQRAEKAQASPIRKLVPLADAAKEAGIIVYHLNIGQPDIPSPPAAIDAIRKWEGSVLAYGHSEGQKFYRETLVKYYRGLGLDVNLEDVFVTTAGSEAIIFAMAAVADPADEIIVFEPFYTNYNGFASMVSVRLVPITLSVENGFHLPDRKTIESRITEKTRAILYCSPNNPTGTVYTREEVAMLSEIAAEHDLFLMGDEVYREFVYDDGVTHTSVLSFPQIRDRAIMLDSISKRFSMCGARIGNIVTKNRDIWNACLKFGQARLCPPQLEQVAAGAAYGIPPEDYILPMIGEYKNRRDTVYEALTKMPGVKTFLPEGAFYAIAALPVDDADRFAAWLLSDFWKAEGIKETVMLAPASGFYATPSAGTNEVRIAYVLERDKLARAMELLARALEVYPGKRG